MATASRTGTLDVSDNGGAPGPTKLGAPPHLLGHPAGSSQANRLEAWRNGGKGYPATTVAGTVTFGSAGSASPAAGPAPVTPLYASRSRIFSLAETRIGMTD